jgi:hypothetical protein
MRRLSRSFLLIAFMAASVAACSGSSSADTDPLRGVNQAIAARLCKAFFVEAEALRDARNTFSLDRVDATADSFERLAGEARAAGATGFARESSELAKKARALAQFGRGVSTAATTSPTSSGSTTGSTSSTASMMTVVLELQLPETRLSLACYRRGITPFEG